MGGDSRVTVESPLTLRTETMPTSLYLGFDTPLEAWLSREGETLVGDAMPEGIGIVHMPSGPWASCSSLDGVGPCTG